jgi:hypothetical protein
LARRPAERQVEEVGFSSRRWVGIRGRRKTSLGETTRGNYPWYHPLSSARAGSFGSWVRMRAGWLGASKWTMPL